MLKSAIKLAMLTLFSVAMFASPPSVPAFAAGGGGDPSSANPPPPPDRSAPKSSSKSKKKAPKQSSADDDAFRQGYRAAHATIYQHNDYAAAIGQLKALGHDDNAGVANLIGYSYRKLGDYRLSQTWYERALKADPNHVLTWQYYGLWQIEQGNRDQASYHLSRIAAICGTGCDEYRSLATALEKPPGTGLVY
jgi:tetratricopeptide (TPR) repeat protein